LLLRAVSNLLQITAKFRGSQEAFPVQDFRSVARGDVVAIGPLYAKDFREYRMTLRVESHWHPQGRGVGWIYGTVIGLETKDGRPLSADEPSLGKAWTATDILAERARVVG
jgi:hypothetical protein